MSSHPKGKITRADHRDQEHRGYDADVQILSASSSDDVSEWQRLWAMTPHREPQAHPAYATLFADASMETLCAVEMGPTGMVLFPFHTRPIPFAADYRDAVTPYGYGGAYVNGTGPNPHFWRDWDSWARSQNVVSLTTRRHLFEDELLISDDSEFSPLDNVVVDLAPSEKEIWASLLGRARTDIRKAQSNRVQVEFDPHFFELETFHRIYTETMQRNGALDYYMVSLDALEKFVVGLGDSAVLVNAIHDGVIVASELQLKGRTNAYYFLSGTTLSGRSLRASSLVRFEAIIWLKSESCKRYVLGGGLSKNDQLFKYKSAFAPRSTLPFKIGYRDIQPEAVSSLSAQRKLREPTWMPIDGYLPIYRAPGRGNLES